MHITPYFAYYGQSSLASLMTEAILPMMSELKVSDHIEDWTFWMDEFKGSYLGVLLKSTDPIPLSVDTKIKSQLNDYIARNPSPDTVAIDHEEIFMDFSNNQLLTNNYQYTEEELASHFSSLDHSTAKYSTIAGKLLTDVTDWHHDIGLEKTFTILCILINALRIANKVEAQEIIDQLTQLYMQNFRVDVYGAKYPQFLSESDSLYQKLSPALREIMLSINSISDFHGNVEDLPLAELHSLFVSDIADMHDEMGQSIAHADKVYRLICVALGQKVLSGLYMLLWMDKLQSDTVFVLVQEKNI
jgi:hypothetical protein